MAEWEAAEQTQRAVARVYVRDMLGVDRRPETAEVYERMMYRLHAHVAPDEPFDAPEIWLADVAATCASLRAYSVASQLKHLSVIIEMLRALGASSALTNEYLSVRASGNSGGCGPP